MLFILVFIFLAGYFIAVFSETDWARLIGVIMVIVGISFVVSIIKNDEFKNNLIKDKKIVFRCDDYGKNRLVLIDSTMTNTGKFLGAENE